MPNHSANRTTEKLRFSLPSALRASAAGYLKRDAFVCRSQSHCWLLRRAQAVIWGGRVGVSVC